MNTNPTIAQTGFAPRFAQTSCSQCGCDTGPGDAGHSSCKTHNKPKARRYSADLDTTISGIPCGIRIDSMDSQDGDSSNDASDWDHDGWCDIFFTVLDSKGYEAKWLQAKLTDADTARIEREILESLKEQA